VAYALAYSIVRLLLQSSASGLPTEDDRAVRDRCLGLYSKS
jgi:hypothetical protein